jgi:hypothetical protein
LQESTLIISHRTKVKTQVGIVGICILLTLLSVMANASERVLDDAAWRSDISTVADTIRDVHPRPFRNIDQNGFEKSVEALLSDVWKLSDKEIIVRLASLVALIDDGHTRLAIPRQHPEIGLEFGHTPTPAPAYAELELKQLPLAFEKFDDGVFVVSANEDHAGLIGREVIAIDGTPVSEALATMQAITFAENSQLEALMGADRLSLIEALAVLGISQSDDHATFELEDSAGAVEKVRVTALPRGPINWTGAFGDADTPMRLKNPDRVFWSEHMADDNVVYMQLDEITDGDISLAEFVTRTLATADNLNAKLVIDIRNNFGGSGGLNKTLVMALLQNEELNQYNRTFVLMGRRTFSAAQMLVNELEQYTRVSFVGEATGSRPDHFGDPKKLRLENSGLTLRVSRLHWSSYTAFDEREAAFPDFPALWTSADYFSGSDPAYELALSLDDVRLKTLLSSALQRGDLHQIGRYTLDSKRATDTYQIDFSELLLELGKECEERNDTETASFTFRVGLFFYPEHVNLAAALKNLESS